MRATSQLVHCGRDAARRADDARVESLLIHGGAGRCARARRCRIMRSARGRALSRALDAGSAVLQRAAARSTRSKRPRACSRMIPASTPAAAACSPPKDSRARRRDHGRAQPAGRRGCRSRTTRAPISLARAADGAAARTSSFRTRRRSISRASAGFEQVDNDCFVTGRAAPPARRDCWRQGGVRREVKYGTVGAVAVDRNGHVAAATSTGGLTAKRWGRIGDSPLIGAGTYADDRSAAVSATGSGEYFIRAVAGAPARRAHPAWRRSRFRRRSTPCFSRHQRAWRHRRADRRIAVTAKRPGASRRRRCIVALPTPRRAASRSTAMRTSGRAIGPAAIRSRPPRLAAPRREIARPLPGSPGRR